MENLRDRIEQAAAEFQMQRQLLQNAQDRLKSQKTKLDIVVDSNDLAEIEREEKILKARRQKLGEITALEVLTEYGLLPNYAFPERGVRFSGSTYNRHHLKTGEKEQTIKPIELIRAAGSAIRELAPANHFYTHSHKFDIQQLEIGSRSQPLIEHWAICGQCAHMRLTSEVDKPDAIPVCPQCGYDGPAGQLDRGSIRLFCLFNVRRLFPIWNIMRVYRLIMRKSGKTSFTQSLQVLIIPLSNRVAQWAMMNYRLVLSIARLC